MEGLFLMTSVYLAGPIDACSQNEVHTWRNTLKNNYPDIKWLDPSVRCYPLEEWDRLVEDDLADIRNADAILAYVWKPSAGTAMELVYGHCILYIPVIVVVPDLAACGPWIRYHADYVVTNWDEAVKLLMGILN